MPEVASPSLQRTILRLVQTHGTIERSILGLRSRSYDMDNWEAVLDDLVDRGLITEDAHIRVGKNSRRGQKRAVIIYRLGGNVLLDPETDVHYEVPDFTAMTSEEVQQFVGKFPRQTAVVS